MCAVSTPELEKASAVTGSRDSSKCAVCAGVLTLDQVILSGSDQAAAELASKDQEQGNPKDATAYNSIHAGVNGVHQTTEKVRDENAGNTAAVHLTSSSATQKGVAWPCNLQNDDSSNEDSLGSKPIENSAADYVWNNLANELKEQGVSELTFKPDDGSNNAEQDGLDKPEAGMWENAAEKDDGGVDANFGGVDESNIVGGEPDNSVDAGFELIGKRVRELPVEGSLPRKGLVFLAVGGTFAVAFDDLNWRSFPVDGYATSFEVVPDLDDAGEDAVRSVLLGRKGALNMACGYLLHSSSAATKPTAHGWEVYQKYKPAPIDRCPKRFAKPPLDIPLARGDAVLVKPPFVCLSGGKAGVDPASTFTGRVVSVLIGGTWNQSNQHTDKRRWVLVDHGADFYILPLESVSVGDPAKLSKAATPATELDNFVQKLVTERSTGSVNNLYQAARNAAALRQRIAKAEEDGARDGLRPRAEKPL
eukprot:6172289-Pleurochrysis_carterae.AAC.1